VTPPQRALWILLLLFVALWGLFSFPVDDGLRYVGFAFGERSSWGDVYPFSIFETFPHYDPWWGHDLALRVLATGCGLLPVPPLLAQVLLTKALSAALMAALVALALARSRLAGAVTDARSLALACGVALLLLALPLSRVALVRPLAFGTLLLVYACGARGFVRGALASAGLFFFYPYLAWVYTLPVAFAHLVRGSRPFGAAVLATTVVGVAVQPRAFWAHVAALIGSDYAALGTQIGELAPGWAHPFLLLPALVVWLWLVPRLAPGERRPGVVHVLLVLFAPAAVVFIRYFSDALLPLLFVAYARPLVRVLRPGFDTTLDYWLPLRRPPSQQTAAPGTLGERIALAVAGVAVLGFAVTTSAQKVTELSAFRDQLAPLPPRSLVLSDFNLQYSLLFVRPDLRLVPSPGAGLHTPDIDKEYAGYYRGEVCPLARRIRADFFIENGAQALRPERSRCLTAIAEAGTLRVWRVRTSPER
jgi:hypothetical protein